MPLTKKGTKILSNMKETYGDTKKAESVFYASINSGKITGAERSKRAKKNNWNAGGFERARRKHYGL